jgi:DNA-binding response OmpR family regulator
MEKTSYQGGIIMPKEHILVVEDDRDINQLITDYLKASDYEVTVCHDGESALKAFRETAFDLAILDIMLPKVDGFELCRQLRQETKMPIIMLSAKKADQDKILSLGLGADDYVEKPFSPRVLIARVQSHLRRYREGGAPAAAEALERGDIRMDLSAHQVFVRGEEVTLSVKEFDILRFFLENPNQALSRERIFDVVWGYNEYGDINTVTVHVRKLREKIEQDASKPALIETVWGIGYKLKA